MDGNHRTVTPLIIPSDLERDELRHAYVHEYAWAIPSEGALAVIVALGRIVEVGAGSGYWAQLLRERGADVLAFDEEPDPVRNTYITRVWGPVAKAPASVARKYPDRVLLLIWPPLAQWDLPRWTARWSWLELLACWIRKPMAYRALSSYQGNTLVYIGEGRGDACADEAFFHRLRAKWRPVQTVEIPTWGGSLPSHDSLTVYQRR